MVIYGGLTWQQSKSGMTSAIASPTTSMYEFISNCEKWHIQQQQYFDDKLIHFHFWVIHIPTWLFQTKSNPTSSISRRPSDRVVYEKFNDTKSPYNNSIQNYVSSLTAHLSGSALLFPANDTGWNRPNINISIVPFHQSFMLQDC